MSASQSQAQAQKGKGKGNSSSQASTQQQQTQSQQSPPSTEWPDPLGWALDGLAGLMDGSIFDGPKAAVTGDNANGQQQQASTGSVTAPSGAPVNVNVSLSGLFRKSKPKSNGAGTDGVPGTEAAGTADDGKES